MKKVLLFTLTIFISSFMLGQHKDEFGFDYKVKNGYRIFTPTWNNIFNSVSMPSNLFHDLMSIYNYSFNNSIDSYVLQNPTGQGIYSVKQEGNGMTFSWAGAILEANELRGLLKEHYVSSKNGVDNYIVKTGNGKVIIHIKDRNSEAGFVLFSVE